MSTALDAANAVVSPLTTFRAVLTDSTDHVLFGSAISTVNVSKVMAGLDVSPSGWLSADELRWPGFTDDIVGMWVVREFDSFDPTLCFVPFVVNGDGSDLVIEFNPGVLLDAITVGGELLWVGDSEPLLLPSEVRLAQFAEVTTVAVQGLEETRVLIGSYSGPVQGIDSEE